MDEIDSEQMRRFADAAGLPPSALWRHVIDITELSLRGCVPCGRPPATSRHENVGCPVSLRQGSSSIRRYTFFNNASMHKI